jgi:phosphoribosyl 1,2-cyclic phosphate phosphodiesterase
MDYGGNFVRFTVLGSGGAIRIPRACCSCKVCQEARIKGFPYKRLGQSLFLHEESILFDTPEDINEELNIHGIDDVKHIFFTHWHPDHTLGCRIIETLMDSKSNKSPIVAYMPPEKIEITINKDNSIFSFYEYLGYCKVNTDRIINFKNITIERIKLLNGFAYAYMIKEADKRVLYCPCHSMYLPISEELFNLDLIIMGFGYINYLADDITNFKRDNLPVIEKLKPKKVIFTHIEEDNKLSFDDYKELEEEYTNFIFAYDGMNIDI